MLYVASIFQFEFFMGYVLGLELDILMGSFIGLKYARFYSIKDFISVTLSIIIVSFYAVVTFVIVKMIIKSNRGKKEESDPEDMSEKEEILEKKYQK